MRVRGGTIEVCHSTGEYEPSPQKWVRDQVEEYETSGGTEGDRLRG